MIHGRWYEIEVSVGMSVGLKMKKKNLIGLLVSYLPFGPRTSTALFGSC